MTRAHTSEEPDLQARVLAILDANRVMTVATLRPDGWPQATIIGYVRDGLTLYFVTARDSQKLANILKDPRVSIALGQESPNHIRGLSMAASAEVVTDAGEIERLNDLIGERYPEQTVFAPRAVASAIVRVSPQIISLIDHSKEPGEPELLQVTAGSTVKRAPAPAEPKPRRGRSAPHAGARPAAG